MKTTQLLIENDSLELDVIDVQLLIGKIFRNLGAQISSAKIERNKILFGVNYPSAITEALITVKTTSGAYINNIILKVDSGASVSLSHSEYLTDIKNCKLHNLSPVRLNGIGGKTEIMDQVGILNIIPETGNLVKIKCYSFDTPIGDTTRLCLLSNWAIDHYKIDQRYHARTSLRVGPQNLRFISRRAARPARAGTGPANAPSSKRSRAHDGKPKRAPGAKKRPKPRTPKRVAFNLGCDSNPKIKERNTDSLMILKEYMAQLPVLTASALSENVCNCEPRYTESLVEETFDCIQDGTVKTTEARLHEASVLLCQNTTRYTEEQLLILEPGILLIPKPLVLMSEIQLKGIQDRLGKLDLNQKTDGAEMMTKGGQTYSKFSYQAMEIGEDVTPQLKSAIDRIFNDNIGEDAVFPTKNGAPKILTKYLNRPYSYELLPEYENGSKSLPSAKAQNWVGKEASSNIIRDFVQNTPIVEPCPHPRCVPRFVIVPEFAPGQPKSDPDHGFRIAFTALMNECLKPCAIRTYLATGKILKSHHCKYYLQCDGLNAFWTIPVWDESKRLTAFHTPDGIYWFNRQLMGAKPSSASQHSAYLDALDKYIDIDEEGKPRLDKMEIGKISATVSHHIATTSRAAQTP